MVRFFDYIHRCLFFHAEQPQSSSNRGYLCLFGAAFPFALFLAFSTNYIETRTDGSKLLLDYRRVLPNRVSGIGEPLYAFYVILYLAVPMNAGLCVYTFEVANFIPRAYRVWIFTLLTVALAFAVNQLDNLYPDLPRKTAVQMKRQRVIYKRVILGEGGDDDEDGGLEVPIDESMIGLPAATLRRKINRTNSMFMPGSGEKTIPKMNTNSIPSDRPAAISIKVVSEKETPAAHLDGPIGVAI
jgi:hypothetical protein